MKKVFYLAAVLIAIALIISGVITSRKKSSSTNGQTNPGGFNSDQLQDAAEKQPIR